MTKLPKKPKQNYIDNAQFVEAIKEHKIKIEEAKKAGKEPPRLSDYIGDCLLKIAQRMAYRPEFIRYSFTDDMILDAIENSILYFDNFDPYRIGNRSGVVSAFGYFSQITYYAFQRRILKEQKYRYTKCKILEKMFVSVDGDTLEEYNPATNLKLTSTTSEFVTKYETREKTKKLKRDEKKRKEQQDGEK